MTRIFLTLLISTVIATSCTHKYYIVRHAEKEGAAAPAGKNNNDPVLSEAGKVRALVLRDELKDKHIRYIFSTTAVRAVSTAEPLSQASGLKIQLYDTRDTLDRFIARLKSIKKGNVLIVGHSNTVDELVNRLCNATKIPGDLPESQYDNMFVITCRGKKISFQRSKYGYPSNPE